MKLGQKVDTQHCSALVKWKGVAVIFRVSGLQNKRDLQLVHKGCVCYILEVYLGTLLVFLKCILLLGTSQSVCFLTQLLACDWLQNFKLAAELRTKCALCAQSINSTSSIYTAPRSAFSLSLQHVGTNSLTGVCCAEYV